MSLLLASEMALTSLGNSILGYSLRGLLPTNAMVALLNFNPFIGLIEPSIRPWFQVSQQRNLGI